jgi:O-6-methylguanine DNA methyltransferase
MAGFRQRVLEKTVKIPRGRVTTYKELACAVGRPRAWRAVANVLVKNQKLGEIPCHRVVRSDGGVGGYRQGKLRKAELLRGEGVVVEGSKIDIEKFSFRITRTGR